MAKDAPMPDPRRIATIHLPQPAWVASAVMLAVAEVIPGAVIETNEAGDEMYLMRPTEDPVEPQ